MRLVVLNNPRLNASNAAPTQRVVVKYDPEKKVTIIDCDVDIVTLGIAVHVLSRQYTECLQRLDQETASKIDETTRKAVSKHAVYRS